MNSNKTLIVRFTWTYASGWAYQSSCTIGAKKLRRLEWALLKHHEALSSGHISDADIPSTVDSEWANPQTLSSALDFELERIVIGCDSTVMHSVRMWILFYYPTVMKCLLNSETWWKMSDPSLSTRILRMILTNSGIVSAINSLKKNVRKLLMGLFWCFEKMNACNPWGTLLKHAVPTTVCKLVRWINKSIVPSMQHWQERNA